MWKILLPAIGVPVLLIGAAQGYVWYTTKQNADQLIGMLAPFASVTYRGVHASLLGSVGLNDVRITPNGTSDPVDIRAIRIEAPSIVTLYTLDSYFKQGQLPPGLSIAVRDLRAGLYSDFVMQAQGTALVSDEEACSLLGNPGPEQLEAMGYDEFRADMSLGYTYDEQSGQLNFEMTQDAAEMFVVSVDWRLVANLPGGSLLALQSAPPTLAEAGISFEDQSFIKRQLEFCAAKQGQSLDEFVQAKIAAVDDELAAAGISVSTELLDAYVRFLDRPEQIELRAQPSSPLNLGELALYQPSDLPRLLNLQVSVNGQAVDDLRITFSQPLPSASAPVAETETTDPTVSAAAVAPVATQPQLAFRPTAPTELSAHVGKTVRITISNGRVYEGSLEEVSASGIKVRSRFSGGTATFPVPFERIREASVLY